MVFLRDKTSILGKYDLIPSEYNLVCENYVALGKHFYRFGVISAILALRLIPNGFYLI